MSRVVVALYDTLQDARNAVDELIDNGFDRERISLISRDESGEYSRYLGETKAEEGMEGAAAGAGIGAVLGGLGGVLLGLGALAIPGIGPIIAAGPLAAGLAGAGIGAVAGGLLGALTDVGIPEEEAKYYVEGIRQGGTLVTVQAPDNKANQAATILNRFNPIDLDERVTEWGMEARRTDLKDEDTLEVVEEDLRVGKREVETGRVRAHTYITERPVEEDVRLRSEHVEVERTKVDRPASERDLETFEEGTIEVTETAEEPVVQKEARVVEEVRIRKEVEEHEETIRETLRRKDVDVERMDIGTYDPMFHQHYQTSFTHTGSSWEDYQPAYYYGYELALDDRYRGRKWNQIEAEVRRDWERQHTDSLWEDFKDAVQAGWETVTGQR